MCSRTFLDFWVRLHLNCVISCWSSLSFLWLYCVLLYRFVWSHILGLVYCAYIWQLFTLLMLFAYGKLVYHFALAQDSLNLFCSFAFLNMIMWYLERNLLEILVIECTLLKANGNTNRHYRGCDLIDLMTNLYKLLILSVRF